MGKKVLIETRNGKREIALMDGSRLLAFVEDTGAEIEAEQVYLAVVDRLVKGMEACFVRLGKNQVGFLPFAECKEKPRSGDKLLVQVKRPPVGEKAAYVTADIALAERFAVFTPLTDKRAVSQKITDENERARLKELAGKLAPAGGGLVMRTESAEASEEDIAANISALAAAWDEILDKRKTAQAPCILKGREDALLRLLRDEHGEISEILTDAPDALPPLQISVQPCEKPFDLYSVRGKLEKSMQRKVWLDCGGYLIIDKTEALTVIDVNSGKFTGNKTGTENTFLKLNIEAAQETARLLRLRNIGGIIIIDFVDMQSEDSRDAVSAALTQALRDDPVKAVVHGFTTLGLMEMTRKKN